MNEHDPIASVVFWVTLIFSFAVFGRFLAKKCHQPGVLGELLMGILIGNLGYAIGLELMVVLREGPAIFSVLYDLFAGSSLTDAVASNITNPKSAKELVSVLQSRAGFDYIKIGYALDAFSRYGLIFLLFLVGIENSTHELRKTGREAFSVAIVGVFAPIILGFITLCFLLPTLSYKTHLFIAATLSATSIGITASVLKEMKKLATRESKTILGAAMIDDILGLIILAVVSGIVINNQMDTWIILKIILCSLLFFSLALLLGPWFFKKILRSLTFVSINEGKLIASFVFLMLLSWLATYFQLASLIGAFTAGLIIHDELFDGHSSMTKTQRGIAELLAPFEIIFTPLFFILVGIQVKLEAFFSIEVIEISAAIILAAILGKLLAGLGANKKDDRLLVGIGMMPRGEVGLVFASVGKTLGVINDQLFSAIILMVIVTTFLAPLALKIRFKRHEYDETV